MDKLPIIRKIFLINAAMMVLIACSVVALPRLSVEQAKPCVTCHVNPNGGGMRNEYANREIAIGELSLPQLRHVVQDKYKAPRINESITYGFDTRYQVNDDGQISRSQTDVYVNVELWPSLNYYFRFEEDGVAENYGLFSLSQGRQYLKVGRFYPAYGLHIPDHAALIRDRIGYHSRLFLDGLSFGADPFGVNLIAEFFYPDEQRLFVGQVTKQGDLGLLKCLAGASVRRSEEIDGSDGQWPQSWALFGGVSKSRFTLLGEVDLVGREGDTTITYLSLTSRLEYGAYLITEYNFFDGDRKFAGGVSEFVRISLELFPVPFVELRPSYTRFTRGYEDLKNDFSVQLHIGM